MLDAVLVVDEAYQLVIAQMCSQVPGIGQNEHTCQDLAFHTVPDIRLYPATPLKSTSSTARQMGVGL